MAIISPGVLDKPGGLRTLMGREVSMVFCDPQQKEKKKDSESGRDSLVLRLMDERWHSSRE